MRATIHLVTADDCLLLRPLMQPVLDAELARHREFAPALAGVDLDAGARLRAAAARRARAPGPSCAPRWRSASPTTTPPRSPTPAATCWRSSRSRPAACGAAPRRSPHDRRVVARPPAGRRPRRSTTSCSATSPPSARRRVADVAAWSRLTGLREVFERLRPRLRTFRDERGRELFDLPDAPRPDPDTPAPPRFLPEYDNVLLSHADRSRFIAREESDARERSVRHGRSHGAVLYDGVVCGSWRLEPDGDAGRATLVVTHLGRLTKRATTALSAEGRRLLGFVAGDADVRDVRFAAVD